MNGTFADTALLANIVAYLGPLEGLLRAVLFLVGMVLVIQALRLAGRRSEFGAQAGSWATPMASFLTGAALLAFPSTIAVAVGSLFGSSSIEAPEAIFSYGGPLLDPFDGPGFRASIGAIVMIIQFVGLLAVARGLLFLNQAATPGGPRTLGPGFTFLVAGALAVNFPAFFGLLATAFDG